MQVAQRLYEEGHITYMRTDSTSLSAQAVAAMAEEITSEFGKEYLHVRKYKSKNSSAQEAHEAIRPTEIGNKSISGNRDEQRLYELIWKRAIASQMSSAQIEKTTVKIQPSKRPDSFFEATGEVLKFEGFLKVYIESSDDDEEEEETKGMLPPLKTNQALDLDVMEATQRFTRGPARYTEASLVKKLEELGIGRPSTYAPTITKIMEKERGYVTKESREGEERVYELFTLKRDKVSHESRTETTGATSNRLYASDMGMVVTDFLGEHFPEIMDYSFTADIEDKLDRIAIDGHEWKKMLKDFYVPFHKSVEETIESADRAKGTRILGTDEKTGHTILVQMTRYGPAAQIGTREEVGEDDKPRFASLPPGSSMETISLTEVLDLFKLPRKLGKYKEFDLEVNTGRYGPYVKFGDSYANLGRGVDPLEITKEDIIVIVDAKIKEDAPIGSYKGEPITKGKGRFGPYLKYKDFFVNVPKRYDFENISEQECHELIAAKIEKEANRYIARWEKEKIAIENGRWGPFFRVKKKSVKIPKKDGEKMTVEDLEKLSLDEVKKLIKEVDPSILGKS
jgi:DNA topoisomerase-1